MVDEPRSRGHLLRRRGSQTVAQSVQQAQPFKTHYTKFGKTAIFDTMGPPAPATEWNIVAMGLFCWSGKLHPGRVVGYVSGIGIDRLDTGEPFLASFDLDGKITQVTLKLVDDVALTPSDPDFVCNLMKARSASIQFKDYNSPNPDYIRLDDTERS